MSTAIPPIKFDLNEVKTEKQFADVFPVLKQLSEIETPEIAPTLTLAKCYAQLTQARSEGYQLYAAQTSSETIGAVGVRICNDPINDGKPYAIINNLVIEEDYRGLGLGTDILARAEMIAKKQKANYISLLVVNGNKKNKQFYEEQGYSHVCNLMIKEI